MVVCCVGHALLLTAGIGGLGAVAAAVSDNSSALVMAVALVGVVAVLAALRYRRGTRRDPAHRLTPAGSPPRNEQEEP